VSGCTTVVAHRQAEATCARIGSLSKAKTIEYTDASLIESFTNSLRATCIPLHGFATESLATDEARPRNHGLSESCSHDKPMPSIPESAAASDNIGSVRL
jgi:hypothetical protein